MARRNPPPPRALWEGRELVWAGDGKSFLRGVGEEYLTHPHFEEGIARLLKEYRPARNFQLGLFLPCAYGKPYSQSYLHYHIIKALKEVGPNSSQIHQLILSNSGVVPRELEEHYPYCAYDWNPKYETREIKRLYTLKLQERLAQFITRFRVFYRGFACYLRWNSDSFRAVRRVERSFKIKIPNLSLKTEELPPNEVEEVSLGVYLEEEDLPLIAPSNLRRLTSTLRSELP